MARPALFAFALLALCGSGSSVSSKSSAGGASGGGGAAGGGRGGGAPGGATPRGAGGPAAALCSNGDEDAARAPPLSCLRKNRNHARVVDTPCGSGLARLAELRPAGRRQPGPGGAATLEQREADDRRARIRAILDAMPKAENGGIADEHARLVAAAHMADKEARDTQADLERYPAGHAQLPEGTHVKATKVGGARNPSSAGPGARPGAGASARRRAGGVAPPPLREAAPPPLAAPPETRRRRPRKRKDALAMVGI
ncbi:hypothetical protein JL720_943 [Aureococcus anophagefferens]|nr:hypothetical protein JL720_943 [Aureococcus anophagefferens]